MADVISVFISYSHSDIDFVDRLEADLRARGFVTWVDRRRLEGTVEWQPQIDKAIDAFPMMIVVLSQGALESANTYATSTSAGTSWVSAS